MSTTPSRRWSIDHESGNDWNREKLQKYLSGRSLEIFRSSFTHGVDPQLELGSINDIKHVYEKCTKMDIPPRHPYVGQLVFTAFSGSHQDAINKCIINSFW